VTMRATFIWVRRPLRARAKGHLVAAIGWESPLNAVLGRPKSHNLFEVLDFAFPQKQ
jgi:hypothetical protein